MNSGIFVFFLCVSLSCFVEYSTAQAILPGRCPKVTLKSDFDVTKYVGTWYEIRRYFAVFQIGADCTRAEYSALPGGVVGVDNSARFNGRFMHTIGTAVVPDNSKPANLAVTFPQSREPGKYWVLDTDYNGYSVVFSCTDLGMFHESFSWVLSRTPQLNDTQNAVVTEVLKRNKVDESFFRVTNQNDCNGYVDPTTPPAPGSM